MAEVEMVISAGFPGPPPGNCPYEIPGPKEKDDVRFRRLQKRGGNEKILLLKVQGGLNMCQ